MKCDPVNNFDTFNNSVRGYYVITFFTMNTISNLFVLTTIMTVTAAIGCPKDCSCHSQTLRCQGNILKVAIPTDTKEVYLTGFQPDPKTSLSKVHATWESVLKLQISLIFPSKIMYLADRCFEGLLNLTYLGIHGLYPKEPTGDFFLQSDTFYGLNNVKTLDLSGNPFLLMREVIKSLNTSNIMPALNTIILKDVQTFHHLPVYRTESNNFLKALHPRPIKELSMDGTNFEIDFTYMHNLCKTLEKVSMENAYITALYGAEYFVCPSLKELDFTNASVPFLQYMLKIKIQPNPSFVSIFNRYASFVFNVETLNINNFLLPTPAPLSFDNGLIYNVTGINMKVKYLHFRKNYLKKFNVSFQNMPFPPGTEIDVSDNNIEYIHLQSLSPGNNIRKIDLSSNRLHEMESNYPIEFANFLRFFTGLEEISLASNNLDSLPRNLFIGNTFLKTVNVSSNMLHFISFGLHSLSNLQYLDASNNVIRKLIEHQTREIEKHALNYGTLRRNSSFILDISGNSFDCDCRNLQFVRWIGQTSFIGGSGNGYICTYDGKQYDMKTDAFENVTKECKLKLLKRNLTIGICISFLLTISVVTCVTLWHRYRKKQNKIKAFLKQLRKKDEDHFLAFLSYCSEDTDFVLSEVSQKLNNEICAKTKKRAEYICIGDKHFRPGFPVITEVMLKMENSAVAIFVISQTFCNKSWCHIEIKEAMDLQKPIILIFKESVNENDMPKLVNRLFRQNTRCKFIRDTNGHWSLQPSWSILVTSLIELAAGNSKT
ncbi:toll-like receptor 4 [Mercenaria mercenaria]|uniref:toll-like receptor 4 n=1 Tax=Mercenaria mercenaria TaxID=6596 RepID=UPI00234E70B0|nr:toll-like receptor 4 [Mercenaria mercenaria]